MGGAIDLSVWGDLRLVANDPDFNFLSDVEHVVFDIRADQNHAHVVRKVGDPLRRIRIVQAQPADEGEASEMWATLAEYVDRAVEYGLTALRDRQRPNGTVRDGSAVVRRRIEEVRASLGIPAEARPLGREASATAVAW